jgi:heme A synthase
MLNRRFTRFAWIFVSYLLFVILFGAWVRISGSGNGCGSHWPTCQGAIVPPAPETKTVIEFTHRLTSGLSGLLGIALVVWARRIGGRVFRASLATLFFLLIEAFIGAVLVKKELVAGDASASRAVVIALHLANTLVLMACASATAWWSAPVARPRALASRSLVFAGLIALIVTNMTGAVTALGDTLFPSQPALSGDLLAKVQSDLSAGHHFLVRLRIVHPVIAIITAMLTGAVFYYLNRTAPGPLPRAGLVLISVQVLAGVLNVMLAAPAWMQILHLLIAQVLWIVTFLAGEAHLWSEQRGATGAVPSPARSV